MKQPSIDLSTITPCQVATEGSSAKACHMGEAWKTNKCTFAELPSVRAAFKHNMAESISVFSQKNQNYGIFVTFAHLKASS